MVVNGTKSFALASVTRVYLKTGVKQAKHKINSQEHEPGASSWIGE